MDLPSDLVKAAREWAGVGQEANEFFNLVLLSPGQYRGVLPLSERPRLSLELRDLLLENAGALLTIHKPSVVASALQEHLVKTARSLSDSTGRNEKLKRFVDENISYNVMYIPYSIGRRLVWAADQKFRDEGINTTFEIVGRKLIWIENDKVMIFTIPVDCGKALIRNVVRTHFHWAHAVLVETESDWLVLTVLVAEGYEGQLHRLPKESVKGLVYGLSAHHTPRSLKGGETYFWIPGKDDGYWRYIYDGAADDNWKYEPSDEYEAKLVDYYYDERV